MRHIPEVVRYVLHFRHTGMGAYSSPQAGNYRNNDTGF
jgi:hypothetical protein